MGLRIIPRAIEDVFNRIDAIKALQIDIYMAKIRDSLEKLLTMVYVEDAQLYLHQRY